MGKTRNLFKKIGDTKGTFNAKMGTIKDRNRTFGPNRRDYEGVASIHRRTVQSKGLNDLDNHAGVITHLEPDTLECEIK